jgi:hypothetical protein
MYQLRGTENYQYHHPVVTTDQPPETMASSSTTSPIRTFLLTAIKAEPTSHKSPTTGEKRQMMQTKLNKRPFGGRQAKSKYQPNNHKDPTQTPVIELPS